MAAEAEKQCSLLYRCDCAAVPSEMFGKSLQRMVSYGLNCALPFVGKAGL